MLKIICIRISTLFLALTLCTSLYAQTIFDEYPQNQRFKLKNGFGKVELPLHLKDYTQLTLVGAVNLEVMNDILEKEDLIAVPVEGAPNLAQAFLFFVDYFDTSIGPYRETILSVLVAQKPLSQEVAPRVGSLFWEIQVTSPIARQMGIDVWGYPKVLRQMEITVDGTDVVANAQSIFHNPSIEVMCSDCAALSPFPTVRQDFDIVTQYGIRRTWSQISIDSAVATRPFDANVDTFSINPYSRLGGKLNEAGFIPFQWVYSTNVRGVALP